MRSGWRTSNPVSAISFCWQLLHMHMQSRCENLIVDWLGMSLSVTCYKAPKLFLVQCKELRVIHKLPLNTWWPVWTTAMPDMSHGDEKCVWVSEWVSERERESVTALVVVLAHICHSCNFPHAYVTLPSSVQTNWHPLVSNSDQNTLGHFHQLLLRNFFLTPTYTVFTKILSFSIVFLLGIYS